MQPADPTSARQEGDIVLAALTQANGQYKLRPVLLLRQMPGYGDFLTCGFSSQLNQLIPGFGELVQPDPANGLRVVSVMRLSFLDVVPATQLFGQLGSILAPILAILKQRLADHLTAV